MTGGSLANFDGFWKATYTFFLPADAVNVQFNFSKFFGDDRAVMILNSNLVSSTGIPSGGNYNGSMVFADGNPVQPYTFKSPYGYVSGTVGTGFVPGGINRIVILVNNTGTGVLGTMNGNLAWNDGLVLD